VAKKITILHQIRKHRIKSMSKLFTKLTVVMSIITALVIICLQSFGTQPALSETSGLNPLSPPSMIATAPTAPMLEQAVLGGKPVYVLSMTRAGDRVLVRGYPGYLPSIKIRAIGSGANASQEGDMTCQPLAS
jgi:hypothetical protein